MVKLRVTLTLCLLIISIKLAFYSRLKIYLIIQTKNLTDIKLHTLHHMLSTISVSFLKILALANKKANILFCIREIRL